MIESCYGLTSCPKCGKMVAIIFGVEAQYFCLSCGGAFEFRLVDDVDG